jgi:endoglucanase
MRFFCLAAALAGGVSALVAGTPASREAGTFKWLGVDESVAEFGSAYPGTWGVDFYFPSTTTIQVG